MENWYIHVIHFSSRPEKPHTEIFLGPCTRENILEWFPRNHFKVTEEIPSEVRAERRMTKGGSGHVAIFRVFELKELEGREVRDLPKFF